MVDFEGAWRELDWGEEEDSEQEVLIYPKHGCRSILCRDDELIQ